MSSWSSPFIEKTLSPITLIFMLRSQFSQAIAYQCLSTEGTKASFLSMWDTSNGDICLETTHRSTETFPGLHVVRGSSYPGFLPPLTGVRPTAGSKGSPHLLPLPPSLFILHMLSLSLPLPSPNHSQHLANLIPSWLSFLEDLNWYRVGRPSSKRQS